MGSLFLLHIQMAKTNKVSSELGAQILDFVCDDGRVGCNDLLTSITGSSSSSIFILYACANQAAFNRQI
ncbi:hypothetical protein CsSME_00009004 [Camellia sinensis var. sinensis]